MQKIFRKSFSLSVHFRARLARCLHATDLSGILFPIPFRWSLS
ncbi:hypothetical protein GMO_16390 [Gluconobacter morbifer G707]|uniref:Uncharacterized protein n=1 Tax=Gluconobacter morbifer G707 TaxID=1088869 RepID=G6XJR0_9PROT|nr:hypothetical protein GMO_16390 [Gluconobacter morbifer G707]